MGRIDPKLIVQGEESNIKVVKYKGTTSIIADHTHDFVVYEDDTVEIFETTLTNNLSGQQEKHTHEYLGEYPYGVMSKVLKTSKANKTHFHAIDSVSYPIGLEKTVYGKKSFDDKINRDFNEFMSKNKDISMEEFFEYYQQMFYEIPKEGTDSHKAIIIQSTEYIGDFLDSRDAEIIDLTNQVVELEQKLAQTEEQDKEHPIFTNGSFLKQPDSPTIYYMDKGAKRAITDFETYLILKRVNGHETDKADEEVYILVTEDVIKGLETGPKFSSEDLYGDSEKRDKEEEKKRVELDPDDFIADPSHYDTTSDYIAALDRETRQLLAKEEYVQELYYRYKHDSKNISDEEERNEAKDKFKEIRRELYRLRRRILKYTDILESVDPDGDLKNIEIDTSQLKQIVEEKMSRPHNEFSQAELKQLRSKENKIARFLDKEGKATYDRPKSKSPIPSGGSGGTQPSTTGYLSSMGITGVGAATEEMPKSPPQGYVSNANRVIKNHTANEAIKKMRLGAKSPGGNYYWTLKYRSNSDDRTPELINPKWKIYETSLLTPMTAIGAFKPVSKYYWKKSQFEWMPKPGSFPGVKGRTWEGKTIHKLNG